MYAFGSAIVAGLGPGPLVPGPLLGLCNPVYACKSAVIAGLGPGTPVSGFLDLWNSVYVLGLVVVAGLGSRPPVPGCLLGLRNRSFPLSQLLLLIWAPVLLSPGPC